MTDVIDLDDSSTWPPAAHNHAEHWATTLEARNEPVSDLEVDETQPSLIELLEGRPVRVFHCTRLLDHEVDDIRASGLGALTGELIDRRLTAAYEAGYFDENVLRLLSGTAIRGDTAGKRQGQVCGVIGRRAFETQVDGLQPLLGMWGGEAINMDVTDQAIRSLIKSIGQPSVVQFRLELTGENTPWHMINPDLRKLFAGVHLGLDTHASVHYDGPVPATDIEDIWQPGHPSYDQFPKLPR